MANQFEIAAKRIPPNVAKVILEEKFIDLAINTELKDTPMEYLFDVYEEFVDVAGEYDDWTCFKCREHALDFFKKTQPYLMELNAGE